MELRFGIETPPYVPWEQMVERWQYIEELGFDSVWVPDHFVWFLDGSLPWFEGWTLLAGLATQTERIRVGMLVSAIPFHNPAFLARQALTVDHLSGGRLELGLGAGVPASNDPSYSMAGIEDWAPRERVARFREAVEIVDQLLRNQVSTYEGRYYQLEDTAMRPGPVQEPRPPITIAAQGPAMLKIAARHADTWNSMYPGRLPVDERLEDVRRRNRMMEDCCAEVGRDPLTLRRALTVLSSREAVYASVDAFEDFVGRYGDEGTDEFVLYYPDEEKQLPIFERIATDVIPKLRG